MRFFFRGGCNSFSVLPTMKSYRIKVGMRLISNTLKCIKILVRRRNIFLNSFSFAKNDLHFIFLGLRLKTKSECNCLSPDQQFYVRALRSLMFPWRKLQAHAKGCVLPCFFFQQVETSLLSGWDRYEQIIKQWGTQNFWNWTPKWSKWTKSEKCHHNKILRQQCKIGSVQEKKVFDENFDQNLFLRPKVNFSEQFEQSKHPKYGCQKHGGQNGGPKPKNVLTLFHFSWTRMDHLTWPIDRARSQLFRTYFLASLRSF